MRFIRRLLICLTLAIALVAILAIAAFVPAVQSLIARMALPTRPGVQVSWASLSAGFSAVEVTDLHVEADGAVLTLPSLVAKLPLKPAVWDRNIAIRNLVAKGWTLDLTRWPEPADTEAPAPAGGASGSSGGMPASPQGEEFSARKALRAVLGIFRDGKLPCEGSLDGVEMEGDVLLAVPAEREPVRVHVILKGGGLAAGRTGDFALDATAAVADPGLPLNAIAARGHVVVAMDAARTISRLEITTRLSAEGGSLPENLTLSAGVASPGRAGGEAYSVDLSSGVRHLATAHAGFSPTPRRLDGTWKVDLRDSDLAGLFPKLHFPVVAAAGEGRFETDAAFSRMHALGRLNAVASRLEVLAPALDRVGEVTLDANFDLTRSERSIQVDRLNVDVRGPRPIAVVTSLQPFRVEETTWAVKLENPRADWLDVSVRGLPLGWLAGRTGGLAFVGGDAAGEFGVRATDKGFALFPKAPLVATGVSMTRDGRMLGQGLDLSLSTHADYSSEGWQARWEPLTIGSAGRTLVTIEGNASRLADAGAPTVIAGKWSADLTALASQPEFVGVGWLKGRSATGDFSANVSFATEVKGTLSLVGHDPARSLTASLRARVGGRGAVSFRVPVKLVLGSKVSEFAAEGTWTGEDAGARVDLELTGVKVPLEPFALLAAALPATARAGGLRISVGARDRSPFWGDWIGRVRGEFYELELGNRNLNNVTGTLDINHGTIRLTDGRGELGPHSAAKFEGSLAFEAAAELPYTIKATAAVDAVDATLLFAAPKSGPEPMVEGKFAIAGTLTGNGINLGDLIGRRQEEFRLASSAGIIRFLKTSVAESIPETPSPVSDTLGAVGTAVGSIFKLKNLSLSSGTNSLSKNAEAVLDFTSQMAEIGYDQADLTVVRGSDRTIHLVDLTVSGADERLTGSGEIAYVDGLPLAVRPLSLDVRFAAHGRLAELLATAGLLDSAKDKLGFAMLNQPVHFGGTLEHLDTSQWHDLLVKAATKAPDRAKKGG